MIWILFSLGAVLSWGMYGPALHRGQVQLGNPLRALLCVGMAYFLIGVLLPVMALSSQGGLMGFNSGGSTWAAIGNVRSGNPLTLFVTRNRSRSQWAPSRGPGIGQDRPSMAPGRTHQDAVLGGPDRYFDPAAFVLQPAGTLGNLGRGALIGPDLRSFDFSAVKNNRWAERMNLQFRFEAFNLFNRTNFGPPNLAAFAGAADNERPLATLGRIRSTVTSSRQIQLGLRFSF